VTTAELGFLDPLFALADSLTSVDDQLGHSFGLGEPAPDSALARDDINLEGMWVSHVAISSMGALLDHVIQLRELMKGPEAAVTVNAPWTLMRGALESAGLALWVLSGSTRSTRRTRALRVLHHDYKERGKWEKEHRKQPEAGQTGDDRAKQVEVLAGALDLDVAKVITDLSYGDAVGLLVALPVGSTEFAMARWREASAFAHGRTWPLLHLAMPTEVSRIRGGFALRVVLDEQHYEPLTRLTHDILERALFVYAELSAPDDSGKS